MEIPLGSSFTTADGKPGCWDTLTVSLSGDVIVEGWSVSEETIEPPHITIKGETLRLGSSFRVARKDVGEHFAEAPIHCGMQFVYKMTPDHCDRIGIRIAWHGESIGEFEVDARRVVASGWSWMTDIDKVYHRDDIYQPGPPSRTITPDIADLFSGLSGSALDFGCGIGLYVQELKRRGIDCEGIELDRPDIRDHLIPEVEESIKLYDGVFPLPYEDASFDTCICSEVLEHIDRYEKALSEIARVTRGQLILTVPDFTSVATCAPHHVIPYHMLESTHVNFFNEISLVNLVGKYFKGPIKRLKICPVVTNHVKWFTSLAIIANRT